MDNPVVPKFITPSQYNNALSRKLRSRMRAADRYINHAPAETPARLRAPYRASEWVDLPAPDRAQHVQSILRAEVVAELGPKPEPFRTQPQNRQRSIKPSLTLSALEALVIEQANEHADDLRYVLRCHDEKKEAIVAEALPGLRARVFDRLVTKYRIVEG